MGLDFVSPHTSGTARRMLMTGARVAINPNTGNLVVRHKKRFFEITKETEEIVTELAASFFISGNGFVASFNVTGSTFTPTDSSINVGALNPISAAVPPRGSIAVVSSSDFSEHRNTRQYDSYSYAGTTYRGYFYWVGLSQYYGISPGGGTVYGSRCVFIPPSTVKIWGNPGSGTPKLACAGRRNYKVDDDKNLVQWDEEIWLSGVRADNSLIWDFKYTDSGGTHTDSDIWETYDNGTETTTTIGPYTNIFATIDQKDAVPIATLGDNKYLYSISTATGTVNTWREYVGAPYYLYDYFHHHNTDGSTVLYFGDIVLHTGSSTYRESDERLVEGIGNGRTKVETNDYTSGHVMDYDNINGTDTYIIFLSEYEFSSSVSWIDGESNSFTSSVLIQESYQYSLRYKVYGGAETSILLGNYHTDFNDTTYYPGVGGPAAFETTRTYTYSGAQVWGTSCYISEDHMYFTYSLRTPNNEPYQPEITDYTKVKQVMGVIDMVTGAVSTSDYYPIDTATVPTVTAVEVPGGGSLDYLSGSLPPVPGKNYTFRVCAMNPCSRTGFGVSNTVTLNVAGSAISLNWDAVSDATHYMLGYLKAGYTHIFACVKDTEFLLSTMDTYWEELGGCPLDISLGNHLLPAVGYNVS